MSEIAFMTDSARFAVTFMILVFNFFMHSSLIILIGLVVSYVFKSRSAVLRSAILRTTLVLVLLLPLSLFLPDSVSESGFQLNVNHFLQGAEKISAVQDNTVSAASNTTIVNNSIASIELKSDIATDRSSNRSPGILDRFINIIFLIPLVFAFIWAVSSVILLLKFLNTQQWIKSIYDLSKPAEAMAIEAVDDVAGRLGIEAPCVRVHFCVVSPILTGFFNPVLYLPKHKLENTAYSQDILIHELAHIKRRDVLWNFLARVCIILVPVQPLVYVLAREMEKISEFVCDDYVLTYNVERKTYAHTLLNMAEFLHLQQSGDIFQYGAPLFSSTLEQRIKRIIDKSRLLKISLNSFLKVIIPGFGVCLAIMVVLFGAKADSSVNDVNMDELIPYDRYLTSEEYFNSSNNKYQSFVGVINAENRETLKPVKKTFEEKLSAASKIYSKLQLLLAEKLASAYGGDGREPNSKNQDILEFSSQGNEQLAKEHAIERPGYELTEVSERNKATMLSDISSRPEISDNARGTSLEIRMSIDEKDGKEVEKEVYYTVKCTILPYYHAKSGNCMINSSIGIRTSKILFENVDPDKEITLSIDVLIENRVPNLRAGHHADQPKYFNEKLLQKNLKHQLTLQPYRHNIVNITVGYPEGIKITSYDDNRSKPQSKNERRVK